MGGTGSDFPRALAVGSASDVYIIGGFKGTADFGKTNLVSAGDDDLFVAKLSASGAFVWAKRAGGKGKEFVGDIVLDKVDNIYLVGQFEQTATFGTVSHVAKGKGDVFIAKMDKNGKFLWSKRAGGANTGATDSALELVLDPAGNIYTAGLFYRDSDFGKTVLKSGSANDGFVAKLNNAGTFLWAKQFGGTGRDKAVNIALYGSAVFISGAYQRTAKFSELSLTSKGGDDIFVAKNLP